MSEKTIDLFIGTQANHPQQQKILKSFKERFGEESPVHFTYKEHGFLPNGQTQNIDKWYIASDKLQVVMSMFGDCEELFFAYFTFEKKEDFINYINIHKNTVTELGEYNFSKSELIASWNPDYELMPTPPFIIIVEEAESYGIW